MESNKILLPILLLFTSIQVCLTQRIPREINYADTSFTAPSLPQGFVKRQQTLSTVLKSIENKEYDVAIGEAQKVADEAISKRDTVNLRDAYRMLSKAYHGKEDFVQRDRCEGLIQKLAIAYGYHVDEGLHYIEKNPNSPTFIYDELQLLEDSEGKLTFDAISSPLFQGKFKNNIRIIQLFFGQFVLSFFD